MPSGASTRQISMGIVTMLSKINNSQAVSATASVAFVLRVTGPVAMLIGTITWGVRLALYHRCAMHFLHPNADNNPHPVNVDCQEALSKTCLRTLGLINLATENEPKAHRTHGLYAEYALL